MGEVIHLCHRKMNCGKCGGECFQWAELEDATEVVIAPIWKCKECGYHFEILHISGENTK